MDVASKHTVCRISDFAKALIISPEDSALYSFCHLWTQCTRYYVLGDLFIMLYSNAFSKVGKNLWYTKFGCTARSFQ